MLTYGVVLHHDIDRPQSAAIIIGAIRKLKFEFLHNTAYNPDFAPSDCHVFGPVEDALRFANVKEVKVTVHTWLRVQPKTFLVGGITLVLNRSNKCVEKLGFSFWIYIFTVYFKHN
jgi:hypothetical protein